MEAILRGGLVVGGLRGGRVVGWVVVRLVTPPLEDASSIPLQRSEVQMQAWMVSDSTGAGEQNGVGSTGSSMLPSRMLVGKHSRITDISVSEVFQE